MNQAMGRLFEIASGFFLFLDINRFNRQEAAHSSVLVHGRL
jgi:hypothetical protein